MRLPNVDIYVTGSNSKMLSKEVLTQFRDRGDEIHVYPLSFAEFWAAYQQKYNGISFPLRFPAAFPSASISDAWRDYCTFGGMPYVFSLDTIEEKSQYLKNLFAETYLKDIIERHDIRNEKGTLDTLLDFISSAIGSLISPSKLTGRFLSENKTRISHSTIAKYLDYFEEAYILCNAKRYDVKGSRYFSAPSKYYYSDLGLRNARLNFRQTEEPHIMENIIYNDLIRRGYNVDVGIINTSQYTVSENGERKKSRLTLEVDFVVNHGSNRYYIQSALHIDDPAKREQEIRSLNHIDDSFRKIVVVKDNIVPWHDEKGILYVGVQEFLLNEGVLHL